jgi:hypothetical protein
LTPGETGRSCWGIRQSVEVAGSTPAGDKVLRSSVAEHQVSSTILVGTHLLHFAAYAEAMRGWGRGLRRAFQRWYTEKPAPQVAYQAVKYKGGDTVDVRAYQGIGQFGPAYRTMLEHDAHAPGSVDRVLLEGMVRLCAATARYLYGEYTSTVVGYRRGMRPALEEAAARATAGCRSEEARVQAPAAFGQGMLVIAAETTASDPPPACGDLVSA